MITELAMTALSPRMDHGLTYQIPARAHATEKEVKREKKTEIKTGLHSENLYLKLS